MNASANVSAPRIAGKTWAIIAVVAVLVFVTALFAVRAIVARSAPSAPTGLALTATDDGEVKAVWNSVSGADDYMLVRDDGIVVYHGSGTSTVDSTVGAGEHKYRVKAFNGGAASADGAETSVTVTEGWGAYRRVIELFPKMLPATPAESGFDDMACRVLVQGVDAEMGPSDTGSGESLVDQRLHCFTGKTTLQVTTTVSTDAADAMMAGVSQRSGADAMTWRYGTGYAIGDSGRIFLRVDTVDDVIFAMKVDGGKTEAIDYANTLPIE